METFDGMDHLAGLVGELRDYAVLAGKAPTAVEQWELTRSWLLDTVLSGDPAYAGQRLTTAPGPSGKHRSGEEK